MPKKIKAKAPRNLDTAIRYLQAGDLQNATITCQKILHKNPNHSGTLHLFGKVLFYSSQLDNAIQYISKAISISPHSSQYHYDLGLTFLSKGNLNEAIECFKKTISLKTDYTEAYFNLGTILINQGAMDEAIEYLNKAIELKPDLPEAYNNLGVIFENRKMPDKAIDHYEKALSINPGYADAHNNLGNVLKETKMLDEAAKHYKEALSINPRYADAHNNLGNILKAKGMLDDAVFHYDKALKIRPEYAGAHNNLGIVFKEKGMADKAAEHYRKALSIKPDYAEAHNNLGNVLKEKNLLEDAEGHYRKAILIKPDYAVAHNNIGLILKEKEMPSEAAEHYKKALSIEPDYAEAHKNLALALIDNGLVDESVYHCKQAISLNDNYAEAHSNLGILHIYKGMLNEAMDNFTKALSLKPDHAATHLNMALILLSNGDFDRGWKKYEWRFLNGPDALKPFPKPRWDGLPLKGKTLLILTEQGIGDEIMFSSCLPDLIPFGGKYIMECETRLVPLFQRSFPDIRFIPSNKYDKHDKTPPEPADYKIPIGSLPLFFRPDLSSYPQNKSYLVPDQEKVDIWRDRFNVLGTGLKVGISWRGGLNARIQRFRSISVSQWSGLFSIPGAHFINLQYGDCANEIKQIKEDSGITIHDWEDADPLKDLDGFASQISALDLVISVDNSTVHMAGALGTPVWALLPFACEWRWMHDFEDTPWYQSVRLFRQPNNAEWDNLLERVSLNLDEYVKTSVLPDITEGNSYKNSSVINIKSTSLPLSLLHSYTDKKHKCAVITPVGPGHESLYDECLASAEEAYNKCQGRFSEITYIKIEDYEGKLGRSKARNIAVKQAAEQKADWLFFLDSDDLMEISSFESVSFYLDDYDAVWGSIWAIESGLQNPEERQRQLPFLLSIDDVLSCDPFTTLQMGHFVKTSTALATPFNESLDTGEDFDYYLRIWDKSRCIKIPSPLFINRRGLHSEGPRAADGLQWRRQVQSIINKYRD